MASCTHNGLPIPSWRESGQEYLVLQKFPHLRKRLQCGFGCLSGEERAGLHLLVEQRKTELEFKIPLSEKVALLPGGNLAHVAVDAVVNASNQWLNTGKGVNGALHSAAGECLLAECLSLGGCQVGEAKLTAGYQLPASHVIHTVGPEAKDTGRKQLLRNCYESVLSLCMDKGLRTVGLPCISTGAYAYPSVEAADIALAVVKDCLENNPSSFDRIVFVTRRVRDEEAYGFLMRMLMLQCQTDRDERANEDNDEYLATLLSAGAG